jgi:multicomponent Na+:H+ antiporter subunit B
VEEFLTTLLNDLLLAILVALAIVAVRARDLLAATASLGAYSLVMAILWCRMNAVDVAFTEAAVGAGISTVLLLAAISRIGRHERRTPRSERGRERGRIARFGAIVVCLLTGGILLYGSKDMPRVGDVNEPSTVHPLVAQHYLEHSAGAEGEVGPPNIVTSVLGDYRGYDTLGETVVIFTAGLCVVLLLRQAQSVRRRRRATEAGPEFQR